MQPIVLQHAPIVCSSCKTFGKLNDEHDVQSKPPRIQIVETLYPFHQHHFFTRQTYRFADGRKLNSNELSCHFKNMKLFHDAFRTRICKTFVCNNCCEIGTNQQLPSLSILRAIFSIETRKSTEKWCCLRILRCQMRFFVLLLAEIETIQVTYKIRIKRFCHTKTSFLNIFKSDETWFDAHFMPIRFFSL